MSPEAKSHPMDSTIITESDDERVVLARRFINSNLRKIESGELTARQVAFLQLQNIAARYVTGKLRTEAEYKEALSGFYDRLESDHKEIYDEITQETSKKTVRVGRHGFREVTDRRKLDDILDPVLSGKAFQEDSQGSSSSDPVRKAS
ncbi:MAG: hypothetical protein M1607_03825 [Patescibacteria group bacterium]|nr:hypothetical protein [Patescibacteria group bacterium]